MKLRNKKTGEIISIDIIKNRDDGSWVWHEPESLKSLNEEWEDYTPKEPLIKDEKIRKAVRVWAETNEIGLSDIVYYSPSFYKFEGTYCSIDFKMPISGLKCGDYTIEELCGEEEE